MEILSDQHSIGIIYPRPNGASIAQRACFDLLLRGRGHFSRKRADGFDYQISFRVVPVEDQIVARTHGIVAGEWHLHGAQVTAGVKLESDGLSNGTALLKEGEGEAQDFRKWGNKTEVPDGTGQQAR